ncbi:hypothetical protein PMAYCL1PPCAC_12848, partial [Pristionchus mayeri]
IMLSSLLFPFLLSALSSSAVKIPVTTTEMAIYHNASLSTPASKCIPPSNLTRSVPRSLFVHASPSESKNISAVVIRVAPPPNVAAPNQIRPRLAIDMIENAYLFLACLVMFALLNVLVIDYAYGGPLFIEALPEESLFTARPVQQIRPVSASVAAPSTAPADPIHSAKWATLNKTSPKSVIPKPILSVKRTRVSRKEGSDTEC